MTHSLDTCAIVNRVADAALRQCNAQEASVMLLVENGCEFEIAAVRGDRGEDILGLRVPVERGIAGWVARSLEPLLLHGVAADPRYSAAKPREDITSSVSMPLMAGGKLTGVLNVATTGPRMFVPGQVKALGILGGIAAQALENAQLYGQLQESERRYRTIVETLQEGLWVIDGYGTTTFVNRKMAEILGYTVEEMLGKRIFRFLAKDSVRACTLFLEECQKGGRGPQEFVFLKKDGSRLHAGMETALLKDEQGNQRGIVASIVDISEKKKLQEQLVVAQKMEAVGRLAGGGAHDFNNLLTAISGFGELLKDSLSPDNPEMDSLDEVLNAARSASGLTRQLLAFSRRQVIIPELLDLNDLVRNMVKIVKCLAGDNIGLFCMYGRNLWQVKGDSGMMEQVLINLAVNARDAMKPGGTLTISTVNIAVGEESPERLLEMEPGDYVLISVADTG